jgi:EAL domain-containing protein (putative c-di-GMP-specific phosphodiesterase class I)
VSALSDWSVIDAAGFNLHLAVNLPVSIMLRLPMPALVHDNRPPAPHWPGIILEVREDQIVRDMGLAHQIATQFRSNGITIAIDDFGAGYSSFARLRELPFAEIKLDRTFVANCATDATNAAICQTAIDLAHRFGSAAVAEGIEDPADLQSLLLMGCDFGQGALIAPSMPRDDLIALLRQRMTYSRPRAAHSAAAADQDEDVGRVA